MRTQGRGQSVILLLDVVDVLRAEKVALQGSPLRFIGREDFIAMKVYAGGPVDLQDAENAIATRPDTLDLELVRRLAGRFGHGESLERLLGKVLGPTYGLE